MLSSKKLAALLPLKKIGETLYIFDELGSTNAFAMERAKDQALSGTVVLADRQTAGRGRLDRSWFSPGKANIYGSLLLVPETTIQYLGWIPHMAGVAIAKALEQQTGIRIDLKWPNDLLIGGRKLGGVLCDSFRNSGHQTCVVIGFGINVNITQSEFPSALQASATSLHIQCHCPLDREALIIKVITSLEENWENLSSNGPQSLLVEYTHWCATIGQTIQVQFPDGSQLQGLAHSIGEHGQLQVIPSPSDPNKQSTRMRDIHSGEIFHLRTTAPK